MQMSNVFSFHGFNPRAHERRDEHDALDATTGQVSIHAPTRGATWIVLTSMPPKFQSTRPREARRLAARVSAKVYCFNPRAHERRDLFH